MKIGYPQIHGLSSFFPFFKLAVLGIYESFSDQPNIQQFTWSIFGSPHLFCWAVQDDSLPIQSVGPSLFAKLTDR